MQIIFFVLFVLLISFLCILKVTVSYESGSAHFTNHLHLYKYIHQIHLTIKIIYIFMFMFTYVLNFFENTPIVIDEDNLHRFSVN